MSGSTRERGARGDDGARPGRLSGTGRVVAFSDGVMAIAITVLVLEPWPVDAGGRSG